jgi:hypothetical protein
LREQGGDIGEKSATNGQGGQDSPNGVNGSDGSNGSNGSIAPNSQALQGDMQGGMQNGQQESPMEGARMAPDGNHYVPATALTCGVSVVATGQTCRCNLPICYVHHR